MLRLAPLSAALSLPTQLALPLLLVLAVRLRHQRQVGRAEGRCLVSSALVLTLLLVLARGSVWPSSTACLTHRHYSSFCSLSASLQLLYTLVFPLSVPLGPSYLYGRCCICFRLRAPDVHHRSPAPSGTSVGCLQAPLWGLGLCHVNWECGR